MLLFDRGLISWAWPVCINFDWVAESTHVPVERIDTCQIGPQVIYLGSLLSATANYSTIVQDIM